MPYLTSSGEHKSKPTQHSVKELQSMGISPDIIVLRSSVSPIDQSVINKISLFCNVKRDCVIENVTVPVLYEAPLMLEKKHFSNIVLRELEIEARKADMGEWESLIQKIKQRSKTVNIALIGKYVKLHDAYLSVVEALNHAGYALGTYINIIWIDSEQITSANVNKLLSEADGILIPGGFGSRGIEGKIIAAKFARENKLPYFGICLGMQIAVIEFARNVLGLKAANSREFDENSPYKVIDFMPGQNDGINKGGTLRLGRYPCRIKSGSVMSRCYGKEEISERHRHRYEFNNEYLDAVSYTHLFFDCRRFNKKQRRCCKSNSLGS